MEYCSDLHEWELILDSDLSNNNKPVGILDDETEDGAIKTDYFALDSVSSRHPPLEKAIEEVENDSDNPSWADPDSESSFLETSRGKLGFVGMKGPMRNSDGFWSDDASDGQRSLPDSESVEQGNLGNSPMENSSEGNDAGCEALGKESEGSENSGACVGIDSVSTGEKREKVWWKMPLELLKICIFKARPVWSIPIAAALVGIIILGRKLYSMKHKSRNIPLRIAINDKRASQFVARSARLNAISRHMSMIRPSLPASGATHWAALPLR
ncbi:hypothetical protein KSP40_PGU000593 [Platanthera guangdongensis]|uniref:Uncharacterized protein n=1 Tax=Platanthera guangdongensis TaxID=2320717 RepID=A0ABR2M5S8_9ASPA